MNFFQAQDTARRKTWQLALMFSAAVVTLILLTNVLVAIVFGWTGTQSGLTFEQTLANIPADSWLWISLGVVGVIGVASLFKYLSLQAGGRTIAEAMGGSLIHQSTQNHQQRRLLNVVEEMAIASGVSVPPVYLIPEPSINAFAAGFGPDDAVIGINQGTLDQLDRAELQGVIAHEFSHILNGDTNINLRLIAILHGILFLGIIGFGLLRAGAYSRKNGMPLLALGAGLLVIGYGGTFFGKLIKAAVSRQREFLADASAVQFTRDAGGIADALKKIGGLPDGSIMTSAAAEEASHMFFGASAKKFAGSLLSTHPPLADRIHAIEPSWNGTFTRGSSSPLVSSDEVRSGLAEGLVSGFASAEAIVAQVGAPSQVSLAVAQRLIADNDDSLTNAAHDPFEARALIYATLIDTNEDVARTQLALIETDAETGIAVHVIRLLEHTRGVDASHLLTLVEMSMPALKELSYQQYQRFTKNAGRLITADDRVDVFEWVLHRMLMKELYPHFEGPQNYHGRIGKMAKVADEAALLLAILASHGHTDPKAQEQAYQAGIAELDINLPYVPQAQFDYQNLNDALAKLRKLRPLVKPALIQACAATVLADGSVSSTEGALLQGIAATLDCPLPPSIYAEAGN